MKKKLSLLFLISLCAFILASCDTAQPTQGNHPNGSELDLSLIKADALKEVLATAAPCISEDGDILQPVQLYLETAYAIKSGGWRSIDFDATPSSGTYICYSFDNTTNQKCMVYLIRTDSDDPHAIVSSMPVEGNTSNHCVYVGSTADVGTYYVSIEAIESGGVIDGDVIVTQHTTNPNDTDLNNGQIENP